MSILEQVKANSIAELDIAAPAEEAVGDLHEFFAALGENKSIETVRLTEDFIGDLRHDTRIGLLEALGRIPTLKEVYLADGLLMIASITTLITSSKTLRALTLKHLTLQGVEEHFSAAESALYQHPSLKEFELIDCSPAVREISLDKLSKAGQKFSAGGTPIEGELSPNAKSAKSA
jgi:hypothetical protein